MATLLHGRTLRALRNIVLQTVDTSIVAPHAAHVKSNVERATNKYAVNNPKPLSYQVGEKVRVKMPSKAATVLIVERQLSPHTYRMTSGAIWHVSKMCKCKA